MYGLRDATRVLGLGPRRQAELRRLGLLGGEGARYTFHDLLAMRAAGALLDAGASVRAVRAALEAVARREPARGRPLVEIPFVVEAGRVLARADRVRFEAVSGQGVLDLEVEAVRSGAAAALASGLVRPLRPPAIQAEIWFARARELDAEPTTWPEAIEAYRRVVELDPPYAAAWNNLGLLLHRLARHDEARGAYEGALAADPACAEAAYNLGALEEDCGTGGEAVARYRHALEISPDYADAHYNLAAVLVRLGRDMEALPHWRRYVALDPDSPWARVARAHLSPASGEEAGDGA